MSIYDPDAWIDRCMELEDRLKEAIADRDAWETNAKDAIQNADRQVECAYNEVRRLFARSAPDGKRICELLEGLWGLRKAPPVELVAFIGELTGLVKELLSERNCLKVKLERYEFGYIEKERL